MSSKGIQAARVRLLAAQASRVYCLSNFRWVDCPQALLPPATFVAYRKSERGNTLTGALLREEPWPYWWAYGGPGEAYRLDSRQVEIVEPLDARTEEEIISLHHPVFSTAGLDT